MSKLDMKRFEAMMAERGMKPENTLSVTERDDGAIVVRLRTGDLRRDVINTTEAVRAEEDSDVASGTFSSEAAIMRWGYAEVLSHDPEDANLEPLRTVGSILKNHNPDDIAGVPTEVTLDISERKGRIKWKWGTTDKAKVIRHEAAVDKSLRGISVGYSVEEWIFLADDKVSYKSRIKGPAWVAAKWTGREASLTPIPADVTVGYERNNRTQGETQMDPKEKAAQEDLEAQKRAQEAANQPPNNQPGNQPGQRAEPPANQPGAPAPVIVTAEQVRAETVSIMELCARHGVDSKPFIQRGLTLAQVSAEVLTAIESRQGSVTVTRDERSKRAEAAVEGLLLRSGQIGLKDCKAGGERFAGMSLVEMCRESLHQSGKSTHGDVREVVANALRGQTITRSDVLALLNRKETITGSTGDFPLLLAATMYKSLMVEYSTTPPSWESYCAVGSVSDFKQVTRVEITDIGALEEIPELKPYPAAAFADKAEKNQVFTYGKIFTISRQAVINDDLDGLMRIPRAFGRAAGRMPNILSVKKLLQNPAMNRDNAALFAAAHGNILTGTGYKADALATAEAGFKAARSLLAKQRREVSAKEKTAADAEYLNLMPAVVLCNADDEFFILQTINSTSGVAGTNPGVVNPIRNWNLSVVTDQNIANTAWGGDATRYYMFADPRNAPVLEVVFLNGDRTPYMEEEDQTNVDGRSFKVRLDVGCNPIGYKGGVYVTGKSA